jgi:thiosulfate dehydrogenase
LSDLATFVKQDLIDTSQIVNSDKTFKGDAAKGKTIFAGTCQTCHGENGLNTTPTGSAGMFDEFPGKIASDNPWEFTHKVRYGQPGYEMPPQAKVLTIAQLGDLGAHTQTLPKAP